MSTDGKIGNVGFKPTKYTIHRQIEKTPDEQFSKERQHPCYIAKLPSHSISMNVGIVVAGGTSGNHRHYYESLIYIISGNGYSVVEGNKVEWEASDALHIPPWAWHQHFNTDPEKEAKHLSGTNEPLLQSVGEIAIREEAE
ncbi:MAG: cupin domain-containing protein [Planctomycetes bacterium]|nr:cupin domain-containing protein [Planctomycetota bacterium]